MNSKEKFLQDVKDWMDSIPDDKFVADRPWLFESHDDATVDDVLGMIRKSLETNKEMLDEKKEFLLGFIGGTAIKWERDVLDNELVKGNENIHKVASKCLALMMGVFEEIAIVQNS